MTGPATSDLPPQAREVVEAFAAHPTAAAKFLVVGGIGTGKTATLSAIRAALRSAGVEVTTRASGPPGPAAMVVDDAHLLTDSELGAVARWIDDPSTTVVLSAQPYQHHEALRAVTVAMERENPPVVLGPLPAPELHRIAAGALGGPPSPEVMRSMTNATAGLPFLVRAGLAAVQTGEDGSPAMAVAQGARFALIDRLRAVDEAVLDALLIASLSPDLGAADISAALQVAAEKAQVLVDRARGSGLVEPSHSPTFLRAVHRAAAQILGAARHHDVEKALMATQLEMSTLSADLALRLAEHGVRDDRLADVLAGLAERSDQPVRAARLYRAAVDAGATRLTTRLADTLALIGDCATAGRLADDLLGSDDPADRAAAVRIAASVAVHDGNTRQGADLFRWLGPHPDALVGAAGAVVLLGAGDAAAARASLQAQGAGPPTTATRTALSLADGLLETLDQPFAVAMSRLGQSLAGDLPARGATPDTAAALVTLTAMHGGDAVRARSVISRAVQSGDGESRHRHRLLLGWVKLFDGQLAAAGADVAAVSDAALHRRDALWAAALRTGIARRSGDSGALQRHLFTAMEVVAEYSIDLYSLLPLGELWVAAARLRQVDRLRHVLDEAFGVLDRLGKPVLWSVPLHWYGVHAGILLNSPDAVAPHGQALAAAAASSPFAKVLANQVEPAEVTATARALAGYGQTWDATRLASQAALQTPDPRVSGAMLQLARDLKVAGASDEQPALDATVTEAAPSVRGGSARLSEREREVAELLLLGMPYRDIGNQLFISAKTVEHHVARIRRRLGAESRSEMLSMLRAMLAPQT
jgi:DNA-binding CsgD family transcriptional regulator